MYKISYLFRYQISIILNKISSIYVKSDIKFSEKIVKWLAIDQVSLN